MVWRCAQLPRHACTRGLQHLDRGVGPFTGSSPIALQVRHRAAHCRDERTSVCVVSALGQLACLGQKLRDPVGDCAARGVTQLGGFTCKRQAQTAWFSEPGCQSDETSREELAPEWVHHAETNRRRCARVRFQVVAGGSRPSTASRPHVASRQAAGFARARYGATATSGVPVPGCPPPAARPRTDARLRADDHREVLARCPAPQLETHFAGTQVGGPHVRVRCFAAESSVRQRIAELRDHETPLVATVKAQRQHLLVAACRLAEGEGRHRAPCRGESIGDCPGHVASVLLMEREQFRIFIPRAAERRGQLRVTGSGPLVRQGRDDDLSDPVVIDLDGTAVLNADCA